MDKFPKIYKNKINSIKSKVQDEFYYHADRASDDKKEKTQNAQDGSFKQPTDEQIADKLNHETSGETAKDEIVSSQMISSYVSDKPGVNNILTDED